MDVMCQMAEQIKQLEIKLLHSDMKANPILSDELLADDFEEISDTGEIHSRQSVINWLINKSNHDRWSLTQFKIRLLSADCVLATYYAKRITSGNHEADITIRSSIWKQYKDHWKMVFHQGSRIN